MSGIGTHVDDSTCDFGAQRLADKTERSVHETDRETGGALWGVGGGETLIVGDIESAGVNADENLIGAGNGTWNLADFQRGLEGAFSCVDESSHEFTSNYFSIFL